MLSFVMPAAQGCNECPLTVGLEPALALSSACLRLHLSTGSTRSFRVPLDMMVMASVNKGGSGMYKPTLTFEVQVWLMTAWGWSLTRSARRNFGTGYSLTYRRLFELEVRLLEKSGLVRGFIWSAGIAMRCYGR